eukprot:3062564-Pyramimonas_sp.AAC.1
MATQAREELAARSGRQSASGAGSSSEPGPAPAYPQDAPAGLNPESLASTALPFKTVAAPKSSLW